jgi:hypothetical protein
MLARSIAVIRSAVVDALEFVQSSDVGSDAVTGRGFSN